MQDRFKRLVFDLGAATYDRFTAQEHWRGQIGEMLDVAGLAHPPAAVLDLGCGPGVSTFVLAARLPDTARLVGVDLSPKMLAHANRHLAAHPDPRIDFLEADAAVLPLEDGAVDLATGHSFLYLVSDRPGVLAEIHRVLRPGGVLVLMEPNAEGSFLRTAAGAVAHLGDALRHPLSAGRFAVSMAAWRVASGVSGRLTARELTGLLDAAGFVGIRTRSTIGELGLHCVGTKPAG